MADSRMVVSMKFRRSAALFVLELTAARFWTTIASSGDDRPDAGLAEQARGRVMATVAFWFGLEFADGVIQGAFSHFTISSEVEALGGAYSGPLQARRVRPTVTLGRIQTDDPSLFAWHETVVSSGIPAAQKNCAVTVFDASGRTVAKYALDLAWPCKVSLGPLQVGEESSWGETATLLCENVRRVTP